MTETQIAPNALPTDDDAALLKQAAKQEAEAHLAPLPDDLYDTRRITDFATARFGSTRRKSDKEKAVADRLVATAAATTDTGNAERLVKLFGSGVLYNTDIERWLVYDGHRWRIDEKGLIIERYAKMTAKMINVEAATTERKDEGAVDELAHWASKSQSLGSIQAMIKLARGEPGIAVEDSQIDIKPWLFNAANGTINLRTKELRQPNRNDYLTQMSNVAYDPAATCPMFLTFLDQVMGGDQEMIDLLQRLVGYAATGETSEQVMAICLGGGSNGKSTFFSTVMAALGDYAKVANAEALIVAKRAGQSSPELDPNLFILRNSRLAISNETARTSRLDEPKVKAMTGGTDAITIRTLHREPITFFPKFKLFLFTNHKPIIEGTDEGIWRRILLIPWDVKIADEDRDKDMAEKLLTELPGILAWIVEGAAIWYATGLKPPAKTIDARASYRSEMDVLTSFFAERCVFGPSLTCSSRSLYEAYEGWFEAVGERRKLSQQELGQRLNARGLTKVHKRTGDHWVGIGLLEDATRASSPATAIEHDDIFGTTTARA